MKPFTVRSILFRVQKKATNRCGCPFGVPMKTALLLLSVLVGLAVPSHAQNKVPSFSVSFDAGIAGCVENDGYDSGANVAGRGGCDNPGAQYFLNGVYSFFCCNSFDGSYALTTRSLFDSINGYMLDGASFSGPIAPFSVSGNTWAVGGNNFIYHSGTFFDPTQGVLTTWGKVVTNIRGDAFVLGNAAAGFPTKKAFQPAGTGPLLAEFSGVDNSIVYATYLSSLGFASVPSMARDKGGNIYLSGNGPAPTYQPVLVKLSPNLPQKILYRKTLPYLGGPVAVDGYSQAYLMSGSSGIPVVNAPNPNPGGPGDTSIVVLSPKGDRVVYASYVGGDAESFAGIDVDSGENAHLGGTELGFAWDGRTNCPDGTNNCQPLEYYATFGPLLRSSLPAKLNFNTRIVGTTTVLKLSFKSTGNVPVTVAGATISGPPFTLGNSCAGVVVRPDATCMISVSFTPTSRGLQTGTLTVSSNSLDSPQSVQLSGAGK